MNGLIKCPSVMHSYPTRTMESCLPAIGTLNRTSEKEAVMQKLAGIMLLLESGKALKDKLKP